ncbi:MAG: CpsD/CapB family tyrosine-protein kinase [Mariniblastus sp.]|nr:CpsD/CapB family tyrosine-protein kinase [Mariniblastus sp.]
MLVPSIPQTETPSRSLAIKDRDQIASKQYVTILDRLNEWGLGRDGKKTLGVTSAVSGEGVTTIASNLALHLAFFTDCRVILVDANHSSPHLHRIFGVDPNPGLSDLLCETAMESECIHDLENFEYRTRPRALRRRIKRLSTDTTHPPWKGRDESPLRLSILPAGERDPKSIQASSDHHDFLETVQSEFDIVIVDLPPILSQPKNKVNLATLDGSLFVIQAERTTDQATRRSLQMIQQQGGSLTGLVLNRCRKRFSRQPTH